MTRGTLRRALGGLLAVVALSGAPAAASFHFMQIEQVLGAHCRDQEKQAIQLRMRFAGQNLVSGARLVVRDAAGANPIVLLTFPSNVTTSTQGSRIVAASRVYSTLHGGQDFILTQRIPDSYFPAGRLTFEAPLPAATIYWSFAWGGSGYTGTHTGAIDNDPNGDFGPAFVNSIQDEGATTFLFDGPATDPSTNNAADYILSGDPATLTNNAGVTRVIGVCTFFDGFESSDTSEWGLTSP
jgi:hypothetical protein